MATVLDCQCVCLISFHHVAYHTEKYYLTENDYKMFSRSGNVHLNLLHIHISHVNDEPF